MDASIKNNPSKKLSSFIFGNGRTNDFSNNAVIATVLLKFDFDEAIKMLNLRLLALVSFAKIKILCKDNCLYH